MTKFDEVINVQHTQQENHEGWSIQIVTRILQNQNYTNRSQGLVGSVTE